MAIKDRIKEARLNSHLTQEKLASKIGIAKSTLAGYETGNREPSIETMIKLMSALSVDANYIWQDECDFPMQVSYEEMQHIKKYRNLDKHGSEMVNFTLEKEYERSISKKITVDNIVEMPVHLGVNAAHARTDIDIPADTDTSDDDIMDAEDF